MIQPKRYKRTGHNFLVDAVQVTNHNLAEVAKWCGGEVGWKEDQRVYVAVPVFTSSQNYQKAFVGDWVIFGRGDWRKPKCYRKDAFFKGFDLIEKSLEELAA